MRTGRIAALVTLCVLSVVMLTMAADDKAGVGNAKNPVMISQLPDKITIDGDAAKWANVKALPAPFAKKDAGMLKLAWREDGLYGCVQAKAAKVTTDEASPWAADALEIWLDKDFTRGDDMGDNSTQIALAPNATAGAGKAIVVVAQGSVNPDAIKAMWKPVDGGYVIEFFIPAKELAPAKVVEGSKIGFNYSVDEDGKPVEQFFCDKDTDDGYKTPKNWGAIQLAK